MNLVIFDLETTGIDVERNEIIQIGALVADLNTGRTLGQFEMKLLPSEKGKTDLAKMCEEGFKNCYNEEVWKENGVAAVLALQRFAGWVGRYADQKKLSKANRPYYIAQSCGYNAAKFDMPFILNECRKHNIFLPLAMNCWDTLQLATWVFYAHQIVSEDLKLSSVAKVLGVSLENAHDALGDVQATKEITFKLLRMIQPENNFEDTLKIS